MLLPDPGVSLGLDRPAGRDLLFVPVLTSAALALALWLSPRGLQAGGAIRTRTDGKPLGETEPAEFKRGQAIGSLVTVR